MTVPFVQAFAIESIDVGSYVASWEDAVRLAGKLLVRAEVATDEYTQQMVDVIIELGPYIVIAPGIALAHGRPSSAVKKTGLSWVRLSEPVEFGHEHNDPVDLVIGLAALDHDTHLEVMSALVRILMDEETLQQLRNMNDVNQIHALMLEKAGS